MQGEENFRKVLYAVWIHVLTYYFWPIPWSLFILRQTSLPGTVAIRGNTWRGGHYRMLSDSSVVLISSMLSSLKWKWIQVLCHPTFICTFLYFCELLDWTVESFLFLFSNCMSFVLVVVCHRGCVYHVIGLKMLYMFIVVSLWTLQ